MVVKLSAAYLHQRQFGTMSSGQFDIQAFCHIIVKNGTQREFLNPTSLTFQTIKRPPKTLFNSNTFIVQTFNI